MSEVNPNDFRFDYNSITSIITGTCNARHILSFKTTTLVQLLQRLAKFEYIKDTIETFPTESPVWWPKYECYEKNIKKLRKEIGKPQWREFILHLITHALTFYKQTPVDMRRFLKKHGLFLTALRKEIRRGNAECVRAAKEYTKIHYKKFLTRRRRSSLKTLEPGINLHNYTPLAVDNNQIVNVKEELIKKCINSPQIVIRLKNIIKANKQFKLKRMVVKLSDIKRNTVKAHKRMVVKLPDIKQNTVKAHKRMVVKLPNINRNIVKPHKRMVVKLPDILQPAKAKQITKLNFMRCLDLTSKPTNPPFTLNPNEMQIRRYSTRIPFSSELGKQLTVDNHKYSPRSYNRRLEKINYYLSDAQIRPNQVNDDEYDVTYRKKPSFERFYNFPEKRYQQNKKVIEELEKIYCKPVVVKLVRMDFDKYFLKKYNFQECSVVMKTFRFYIKSD